MKNAVIDISSSSISMIVSFNGSLVYSIREAVSAISYINDNVLTDEGIEKICFHIIKMKEICKKRQVENLFAISTSALRGIDNFQNVCNEVREKTQIDIINLSGYEEAYCDYLANKDLASVLKKACLYDLGGASIEICDMANDNEYQMQSLNFGFIGIQQKFVKNVYPTSTEKKVIKKYVKKRLKDQLMQLKLDTKSVENVLLVGATSNAIYSIYKDFFDVNDDEKIEYKKLKKLLKFLIKSSERSKLIIKNAPEKIYFITTALVILLCLLKPFKDADITVSGFGVKEGYLIYTNGNVERASKIYKSKPKNNVKTIEDATNLIKENSKSQRKIIK